jgi:hypothetical protein
VSDRAISLRDLYFVRDVLIPRCAWLQGPEVEELVRLRLRIDVIVSAIVEWSPSEPAAESAGAEPCAQSSP